MSPHLAAKGYRNINAQTAVWHHMAGSEVIFSFALMDCTEYQHRLGVHAEETGGQISQKLSEANQQLMLVR